MEKIKINSLLKKDVNFKNQIPNNDYIIKFMKKHSSLIFDKYFSEFLKTDEYKNSNNKQKVELFKQAAFFNSCKSYPNIKILKKDFKQISLNFPRNNDKDVEFYNNIIFQLLNNLLVLINNDKFYLEIKNIKKLKKILKYLDISNINKENKIFQQLQKISILLENKTFYKTTENKKLEKVSECIELIKDKLNINKKENKNEKNFNEEDINTTKDNETNFILSDVNIHFDTFVKNDKIDNKNNKDNKDKTSLNDAIIIDNTKSFNSNISINIDELECDKEKEKYNYQQLMYPPILDDSNL